MTGFQVLSLVFAVMAGLAAGMAVFLLTYGSRLAVPLTAVTACVVALLVVTATGVA